MSKQKIGFIEDVSAIKPDNELNTKEPDFFDILPIPLLIIGTNDLIFKINTAAEKLVGGHDQDIIGKSLKINSVNGVLKECLICFPNGLEVIAKVDFTPVDWAGDPARLVSLQNITAPTSNNNELCIKQERFRTLIDFTYDWEYWLLPDQKLVYISPSCKRITGYEASEFIEQPHLLETIVYDEDLESYLAHMKDAFSGEQSAALDFRIVTEEGQVRWIRSPLSASIQ